MTASASDPAQTLAHFVPEPVARKLLAGGGARWLGLIGLVPLASAVLGYCPLYSVLGMDTCAPEKKAS